VTRVKNKTKRNTCFCIYRIPIWEGSPHSRQLAYLQDSTGQTKNF
jgi:hypothetical protein